MKKLLLLLAILIPAIAFSQPVPGTSINVNRYGGITTSLGSKASSASIPVVIANDQNFTDEAIFSTNNRGVVITIPDTINGGSYAWNGIFGTPNVNVSNTTLSVTTANGASTAGTITGSGQSVTLVNNARVVSVLVWGTYSNINLTFEYTADGSTWVALPMMRLDNGSMESTSGAITNTTRAWRAGLFIGGQMRVRSTSYTSGTMEVSISPYYPFGDVTPGTWANQAGTWNIGTLGTITNVVHVDDNSGSLTVDGTVTASNATGNVAHDAADSGNPIKIGGRARTSDFTAVSNDDRVDALFDKLGRGIYGLGCLPENQFSGVSAADITNTTSTSVVSAGGAGVKYAVYCATVSNMSATVATRVDLQDGTTTKWSCPASAGGGGCVVCSPIPLFTGTANTALQAQCGTTGANVRVSYTGCKVP